MSNRMIHVCNVKTFHSIPFCHLCFDIYIHAAVSICDALLFLGTLPNKMAMAEVSPLPIPTAGSSTWPYLTNLMLPAAKWPSFPGDTNFAYRHFTYKVFALHALIMSIPSHSVYCFSLIPLLLIGLHRCSYHTSCSYIIHPLQSTSFH